MVENGFPRPVKKPLSVFQHTSFETVLIHGRYRGLIGVRDKSFYFHPILAYAGLLSIQNNVLMCEFGRACEKRESMPANSYVTTGAGRFRCRCCHSHNEQIFDYVNGMRWLIKTRSGSTQLTMATRWNNLKTLLELRIMFLTCWMTCLLNR